MPLALLSALVLQVATAPGTEVRTLTASILDAKGAAVENLSREEVVVLENGVAREVTSLEKDTRPLALVLMVDNTEEVASDYRLYVVRALSELLKNLPQDTTFAVWATADRPTKLLDFAADPAAAESVLQRALPGGGNTLLDAIVEGTKDLKKQEGSRTAVIVVTADSTNAGNRDERTSVEEAKKNADLFLAVEYLEGSGEGRAATAYGYLLDNLTRLSGGLLERPLTAAGVRPALQKLQAFLHSLYRVSFATLGEVMDKKLEIQVAREGAKIRIASPPRVQ